MEISDIMDDNNNDDSQVLLKPEILIKKVPSITKSQIVSQEENKNNITPQNKFIEKTVVHSRAPSKSSQPNVMPVFDCIF